ncbi:hypothetical protein FN846DRAFT_986283 [Sphaerosporella brunnea]|uniref:Fungal-type protein kinase domain-containing protein n=1 Tax=Sphaerosporella brunnea TaxID=1250544 RepID=A0A5J5ESV6_9PEZI|nr:hypothetical protein FN846DRAFT_986283 [Sphaerosporella brunnea]
MTHRNAAHRNAPQRSAEQRPPHPLLHPPLTPSTTHALHLHPMSSLIGKRGRRDEPNPPAGHASKRSQTSNTAMPPPRTPSSAPARVSVRSLGAPQQLLADRGPARKGRPTRKPSRTSFPPSTETPCKRNSESVREHAFNVDGDRADPSLTGRSEMDLLLYDDLYSSVICDVADMWQTFPSTNSTRAMINYTIAASLYNPRYSLWTEWPADPTEASVLRFFLDLLSSLRAHCWPAGSETFDYVPSSWIVLEDGDCKRKTDVVVVGHRDDPERRVSWLNVRVMGELKSSAAKSNLDDTILQVANYAREVFGAQPNRRWVPAFTLCGSDLRVWRFDRAGACGSTLIDIHQYPEQFLAAITAYATMSATDVGYNPSILFSTDAGEVVFDPTVHWRGELAGTSDGADGYPHVYVPVDTSDAPASAATPPPAAVWSAPCTSWTAMALNPDPISRRIAIATRASVCWEARPRDAGPESPWIYVVKDQWRSYERDPEGVFLRVAGDGVPGMARYIWHSDVRVCSGPNRRLRLDDITGIRPPSACASTAAAPTEYPALTKRPAPTSYTQARPFATASTPDYSAGLSVGLSSASAPTPTCCSASNNNNNILLNPSGPGGFLIDFDLAIFADRMRVTGALHRTGTFDFMARDVLLPPPTHQHTPLHDLESFFYVLLWVCIYYTKDGERRDPAPKHTMFAPQASNDFTPWEMAKGKKAMYMDARSFRSFVLPTLFPEATACLAQTATAWRKMVMQDDEEDIAEETIAQRYQQVLDILETGIVECAGW